MRQRGIFLVTVILISACAATMPIHLTDPAKHPNYRPCDYITAVGMSDKSATDAELMAKSKVSEQVKSSIKYKYEIEMSNEGIKSGGKAEKVTAFTHAEMIRIDTGAGGKYNDAYYAFAYLSRADVQRVLAREYEVEAVKFRKTAETLPNLTGDIAAYTAAYRQAQSSFAVLMEKSYEIFAVTQKDYSPYKADHALSLTIERCRVETLRRLKLTVDLRVKDHGDAREVILMAVTGALTRLGVEATPSACDPQKYMLHVDAEVRCARGAFGPQCDLRMSSALSQCSSGKVLAEMDLSDPKFRGVNTKDESKAVRDLYATVTADALAPLLAKGLKNVLPLDVSPAP